MRRIFIERFSAFFFSAIALCSARDRSSAPAVIFRFVIRHSGDIRLAGSDDGTMVSRIHVADIVGVVEASVERPEPGMVMNVADDLPSTRYEVICLARTEQGLGWRVYVGSRRVSLSETEKDGGRTSILLFGGYAVELPPYPGSSAVRDSQLRIGLRHRIDFSREQ